MRPAAAGEVVPALALDDLAQEVRQDDVGTVAGQQRTLRYWPRRPQRSQTSRTMSPGCSARVNEPRRRLSGLGIGRMVRKLSRAEQVARWIELTGVQSSQLETNEMPN